MPGEDPAKHLELKGGKCGMRGDDHRKQPTCCTIWLALLACDSVSLASVASTLARSVMSTCISIKHFLQRIKFNTDFSMKFITMR